MTERDQHTAQEALEVILVALACPLLLPLVVREGTAMSEIGYINIDELGIESQELSLADIPEPLPPELASFVAADWRERLKPFGGSLTFETGPAKNRADRRDEMRHGGSFGMNPLTKRTASMKVRRDK